MRPSVFVSDIHLAPGETTRQAEFVRWARETVLSGATLYILGDLFDYWLGPQHARSSDYATLIAGLRGVPLRFLWGNRDYLLDRRFARRMGWTVLGREAWLPWNGRRVLLAHGDQVLNENSKYAAYRRAVDLPAMREAIRVLPLSVGRALARGYRRVSPATTPEVVWSPARLWRHVLPFFRRGADTVVCGHIHMPGTWRWDYEARTVELIILGDWRLGGERAVADPSGLRLVE